jgi:hypothetical protein
MATPKTTINGFNIWDVRYATPKSGWLVQCINDHEGCEYFYRLTDAKTEATQATCFQCAEGIE